MRQKLDGNRVLVLPRAEGATAAKEADRTLVAKRAKGNPEIQLVADPRAKKVLSLQRYRPLRVWIWRGQTPL